MLRFVHADTGHVITKHLSIVRDDGLRAVLARGPKYRMRPVQRRAPSMANPTAADYVTHMVDGAERFLSLGEWAPSRPV